MSAFTESWLNSHALTVLAILSALASVGAAVAACRAAGTARKFARAEERRERHQLEREYASLREKVAGKANWSKRLNDDLRQLHEALSALTGAGDAQHQLAIDRIDQTHGTLQAVLADVDAKLPTVEALGSISDKRLRDLLIRLAAIRQKISEITTALADERSDIKAQVTMYRIHAMDAAREEPREAPQ